MGRLAKIVRLEKSLGYSFADSKNCALALTHSSLRAGSASKSDNERLEFLGDRVLGLAISDVLIQTFPDASEGELARRYNSLVNSTACAEVARDIGLGDYLLLSDSEAASGGRDKETILADAIEALLGAIFLEAGFAQAQDVVTRLWDKRIEDLPDIVLDAKSALQEWAQGLGRALPKYSALSRTGPDHAPQFIVEVRIDGYEPARGEGPSKRHAEQAAAAVVLIREKVWQNDSNRQRRKRGG